MVKAENRGPFTLDGTRTFLVGDEEVAVIDPGPDVEAHVRAIVSAVTGASRIRILLTHHHGDHAAGVKALSAALDAPVYGPPSTGAIPLSREGGVATDAGDLVPLPTPGHTRDHLAFHWPAARALFVGDLVLGRGDTTWLGEYPGCVADYLASLDRVEDLAPEVLYPAHGRPIPNVSQVLSRYRAHRLDRLRQVKEALDEHPGAPPELLLEVVYGPRLPRGLEKAARASIQVMLHHLEEG